ncbi:hypothetical protein DCC62_08275 [candidate division KSB1 bacterium]|nr:MAG: hypothetical protein DCC62_08275 [candidate division KSB1 bacterium]
MFSNLGSGTKDKLFCRQQAQLQVPGKENGHSLLENEMKSTEVKKLAPEKPDPVILTFDDTQDISKILDELERLSEEQARKILAQ